MLEILNLCIYFANNPLNHSFCNLLFIYYNKIIKEILLRTKPLSLNWNLQYWYLIIVFKEIILISVINLKNKIVQIKPTSVFFFYAIITAKEDTFYKKEHFHRFETHSCEKLIFLLAELLNSTNISHIKPFSKLFDIRC